MKFVSMMCIGISVIVIIFYLLKKNSNFIDLRNIFKGYWKIFDGDIFSIIVFFVIPALLTLGFQLFNDIDANKLDNINLILSILISMFLTIWGTISNYTPKNQKHKEVLLETNNAILFETTFSILLLIINFIYIFVDKGIKNFWLIKTLSTVIYYFSFLIFINLFVVIKRIHKLFVEEMGNNDFKLL